MIDELFRQKVTRARAQTPGEKLLVGIDLFAQVKRRMCDGIRHQFPDADEFRIQQILVQRLKIARQLESRP